MDPSLTTKSRPAAVLAVAVIEGRGCNEDSADEGWRLPKDANAETAVASNGS